MGVRQQRNTPIREVSLASEAKQTDQQRFDTLQTFRNCCKSRLSQTREYRSCRSANGSPETETIPTLTYRTWHRGDVTNQLYVTGIRLPKNERESGCARKRDTLQARVEANSWNRALNSSAAKLT